LPPEQEQDVADWYRENEFLYNFRTVDYKNKEKMQRVTQEKAETLGITAEQLITWLKSMRDRAGKITKKQPFGSGAIAFYYFVETPYLHLQTAYCPISAVIYKSQQKSSIEVCFILQPSRFCTVTQTADFRDLPQYQSRLRTV